MARLLRRLFTDHPREVGEGYFEHLGQDFAHQVDVMVARLHACVSGQPAETGTEVPGRSARPSYAAAPGFR